MPGLTIAASFAFNFAAREAEQLRYSSIDVEHLFIGLCCLDTTRSWTPTDFPAGMGVTHIRELGREVATFCAALERGGLNPAASRRRMREFWQEAHPSRESFSGRRSQRCRQVFAEAEHQGGGTISLVGFLTAILATPSPIIDRLLQSADTTRERVTEALLESRPNTPSKPNADELPDFFVRFGRDLSRLAQEGALVKAIGRDDEVKRVARVLLQVKKGNPILVGDAGVGKTAIVEGLAVRLLDGSVPAPLRQIRLFELSLASLVAGTKYRGEFEERMQAIIEVCEQNHNIVLFIDEIHMLLGAGAASSSMDAANILKPALSRGSIRCIGATTVDEYRKHIEADPALERRFQAVWVEEPTPAVAVDILQHLRPALERHHSVSISPDALSKSVELSVRYLPDLRLPDKAIDVLDQACARVMLATFTPVGQGLSQATSEVGIPEVAAVISERCRVPIHRLTATDSERLMTMERELGARVVGQPQAVSRVSQAIRTAKAGVRDDRRPVGVFLFLGPSGVGKTELAKALAEFLFDDDRHLIRVDMSEYAEKHSVAKLIGAPPGYLGHDEGGYLTNRVRTSPYSVVLFDEIEKAHPDVYDLFLQIFDEGCLTDSRGRRVDFRDTVIVLTSNVGSGADRMPERRPIGFAHRSDPRTEVAEPAVIGAERAATSADIDYDRSYFRAVESLLRPEIRGRIHTEIVFRPLDASALSAIIDLAISRLNLRLASQRIRVELGDDAKTVLAAAGYTPAFGARSMDRAIRALVEEPLGRMILQGDVLEGQRLVASGANSVISFRVVT